MIRWHHYVGVFLLSLATLLLELAFTRVLSVALWYHFGFLIVSTALLGFGSAGVVLSLSRRLREQVLLDRALAFLAMLFGLATVVCFWLMQRIPFDPFGLFSDKRQFLFMPLYYIVVSVPFFCSGLALALLFTRGIQRINRLYAFDLVGAGAGCAALAVVMPRFGGSGSVVLAAAIGLLAAAVFAVVSSRKLASLASALSVAALVLTPFADQALPISITIKHRPRTQPLYTAWNTFSRIEVYQTPSDPQPGAPAMRRILIDGGSAVTGIPDLRSGVRDYLSRNPNDASYLSGIAYVGKVYPKILVIGSGAGQQVLDALHFGAREVTAVEINPIINDIVSRRMNDYWGGLFHQPGVRLVTEEGRSFIRRSTEQYDAIISVHTISNAVVASGALALEENYVLTREAFEDYFDRLAPDGVIYFTRPEPQIARLFATAREVLAKRGISSAAAHLYAYRIPPDSSETRVFGATRPSFHAGFLLKKSPFTPEELREIETLLGAGFPPRDPSQPAPEVLYSPAESRSASIYRTIVSTPDLRAVYPMAPTEIEPATDDRPFFNHTARWSSINRKTLRDLFTEPQLGLLFLGDRPVAEVLLLVLLAQTVVIAAAAILLPLARFSHQGLRAPGRWRFLVYFAALGFGFILIEMELLSRFMLFFGEPVYTFAVVLAGLLIFTGVGAHVAGRFRVPPGRALSRIVPLILIALIATALVTPILFSAALGLRLLFRIVLSLALIAPLSVLLGMPFPTGLRIVSGQTPSLIPWCWGVNGFFTVIGTVSAQMLAMSFGFKTVIVAGALCYLIALLAIGTDGSLLIAEWGRSAKQGTREQTKGVAHDPSGHNDQ